MLIIKINLAIICLMALLVRFQFTALKFQLKIVTLELRLKFKDINKNLSFRLKKNLRKYYILKKTLKKLDQKSHAVRHYKRRKNIKN